MRMRRPRQSERRASPAHEAELARVDALVESGQLVAAEEMLAALVCRENTLAPTRMQFADVLVRLGKYDEAVNVARRAWTDTQRSPAMRLQFGRMLQKAGQIPMARDILVQATRDFPDDARMHAAHSKVCLTLGDTAAARLSIERACELMPDDTDYALRRIAILGIIGEAAAAKALVRRLNGAAKNLADVYQTMISQALESGRSADALAMAESAVALLPSSTVVRLLKAECLLATQRTVDALAVAEAVLATNLRSHLRLQAERIRFRALRDLGQDDAAISALEQILKRDPDDERTLRDLYVMHQRLGHDAEMRSYGERLSDLGAQRLPTTLAAGLAELRKKEFPARALNDKLRWAWELADKSVWDRDEWHRAAYWGQNADKLLRAWWRNAPERAGELDALIDRPSSAALRTLMEPSRCVCITTHMGPLAGVVRFLGTCGRSFRGFGRAGQDPLAGDGATPRMSQRGGDNPAALRELIKEIEKGTLIVFAQDAPTHGDGIVMDFLGRRIEVSTFVPRLLWKRRVASVWVQALWRDDRMALEIERLPDPLAGAPFEEWCRGWCAAYLEKIERVMRGAPENVSARSGIWRNATPGMIARKRALRPLAGATQPRM